MNIDINIDTLSDGSNVFSVHIKPDGERGILIPVISESHAYALIRDLSVAIQRATGEAPTQY